MPQLRLGILAMYLSGKRLEERLYFQKLSRYGKQLGIEAAIFTPDDVDDRQNRVLAQFYNTETKRWQRRWIPFPPLVYDRCRYHGVDNYRKLSHFRKTYGKLHYLNRPLANKWRVHQLLSDNEQVAAYLPETVRYSSPQDIKTMLKKHRTVFLKPQGGTGGRGIVRIERAAAGGYVLQGRDHNRRILTPRRVSEQQIVSSLAGWPLTSKYVVQQGISLTLKDGRVHDYRLLVQKNGTGAWEITGCAGRIGPRRSVTSNLHGGGTAYSMDKLLRHRFADTAKIERIKQTVYRLGIDVVEHLEKKLGTFCEAGIDVAIDPSGRAWLLEVNPKPSREVFYRIGELGTYRKAITRPLEYALWVHRRKDWREPETKAFEQ